MAEEKIATLDTLVARCSDVIRSRRAVKREKVYVSSIDATLEFHSLTSMQLVEVYRASRNDTDLFNRKLVYRSCDKLRELAVPLVEKEQIAEYEDIVDIFNHADQIKLVNLVMKLSGRKDSTDLAIGDEIDALKNSSAAE